MRLMVAVRQALTLHARRLQAHQQAAGRRRHSAAAATAGSDKENSTAGGTEFGQLGRETYSVERFFAGVGVTGGCNRGPIDGNNGVPESRLALRLQ